jgi:hypothetical protein
MKCIVLLVLLFCRLAHADMYRWVDPDTGSVKFSNLPPAERPGLAVEVLPYQAAPPVPVTAPAPVVTPAAAPPVRAERSPRAPQEARWRLALERLAEAVERPDADRADPRLQGLVKRAEAANGELDKLDPAGAAARKRELQSAMDSLRPAAEPER